MNDFLESQFGILFADPWMLLGALLIPAMFLLRIRRGRPAISTGMGHIVKNIPKTWRVRLLHLPSVLHGLGILLAFVALSRPVVRDRIPQMTEGIDILLVMDLSSSMRETDMEFGTRLTRLDVAKTNAKTFVDARKNDRVGLVTFAAFPDIRCPLTLDHVALQRWIGDLATVEPRSEEDRTGIGLGLARAARALKDSKARSKVVVVLTDGQENVREITPEDAAKLAKDYSIRAYTIAIGRGNRDPFGGWTDLDTSEVETISTITGGKFFRATDVRALESVYTEIDRLEKAEIADPRFLIAERYELSLIPAVLLLAFAFILEAFILREAP